MASHYVLKIQYADGRPAETKKLDMAVAMIGRDAGDVVLGDSQASGRHAELRFANGRLTVRDSGSTNGTFFKGARTQSFDVGPGDSFTIGQTILTVMELVDANAAPPASKGRTMMAMGGVPARPPGPPVPGGARSAAPPPPMGGFRSPPPPGGPAGPAPGGGPRAAGPPAPIGGVAAAPGGKRSPGAGLPAPGGARSLPTPAAAPASKLPSPEASGLPAPGGFKPAAAPGPAVAAAPNSPPPAAAAPAPSMPLAAAFDSPAPSAGGGAGFSQAVKLAIDPVMLPGETIQHSLEADGLFLGPQLIAKLMSVIIDWTVRVMGGYIRISIVVTDRRVLVLQSVKMLCGVTQMKVVHSVALASVVETGWIKGTELCCINTRAVHLQTKTQRHTFVVRKLSDAAMRDFITQMSAVNVANVAAGTAT